MAVDNVHKNNYIKKPVETEYIYSQLILNYLC